MILAEITCITVCYCRYYTSECLRLAYAIPIVPVPNRAEWDRLVPDEVANVDIKAPIMRPKIGRPKNKRSLSQGEEPKRKTRCTQCKGEGHNKATCRGNEYVHVHANDRR